MTHNTKPDGTDEPVRKLSMKGEVWQHFWGKKKGIKILVDFSITKILQFF